MIEEGKFQFVDNLTRMPCEKKTNIILISYSVFCWRKLPIVLLLWRCRATEMDFVM